jgi:hypothetical protein
MTEAEIVAIMASMSGGGGRPPEGHIAEGHTETAGELAPGSRAIR